MHQLEWEGQALQVSEQELLVMVRGVVDGLYTFAQAFHQHHIAGFPADVTGRWSTWIQGGLGQLQNILPQADDEELHRLLCAFETQVQEIDLLDQEWIAALAQQFDTPVPESQRERHRLERKVNEYMLRKGPIWCSLPRCQQLMRQADAVFTDVERSRQAIRARLSHLSRAPAGTSEGSEARDDTGLYTTEAAKRQSIFVPPESDSILGADAELGDQRAADLIDRAVEEPDPRRAVRLLHQALEYGHTGMQASKAYLELGGRHSDLGEDTQAIDCYTKAIGVSQYPSAIAFYWRGEAYYRQRLWEKARSDFEQALSLGINSPESEWAHRYLAAIRERDSGH